MATYRWWGAVVGAGVCLYGLPAFAADNLTDALTGGKVSADIRYRYEWVQQEGISKKAEASTLRTQLGYTTADYYGAGGFLQFEDVRVIGTERYNSTTNGLTQYPIVADPKDTEVNQAYLNYKALESQLKYGRQVIIYDNARFVGDVAWRQNEQTFDAFSVETHALPATVIAYNHLWNVNRIFGDHNPTNAGDLRLRGELAHATFSGIPGATLTGYGYFLDYRPGQVFPVTASNKTLGVRLDGAASAAPKLLYTLEYARQRPYKDGASTVKANYRFASLGAAIAGVQIRANYELLSGDGTYALQTPLATLHAFNGWADKFLVTPTDGIKDKFVSVVAPVRGVMFVAMYHDFTSDNLGYRYGKEWDVSAGWKATQHLALLLKYADFRGDKNADNLARNFAVSRDVKKAWLQAELTF